MGVAEAMRESPGEAIDRLCREQGRRKDWVADQLGLSKPAFSRRVTGRTDLSYLEAKELARIFDVPLETFWRGDRAADGEVFA